MNSSISRLSVTLVLLGLSNSELLAKDNPVNGWDDLPVVLAQIKAPTFPDRDFPITDFGAKPGAANDALPAITKAIAECSAAGGGRVVVPAGKWRVDGPIHLQSNVNLHVQKGATILFSNDPKHFLPNVLTRFEGTELMNYSPLIYALDQENLAVTGEGTLDGQASQRHWWPWKGRKTPNSKPDDPNQNSDVEALGKMSADGVDPSERIFGEGHYLRPSFVQPYRCQNVLIEGITVLRSPMWEIHPVLCTNVTVRDVKINTHGPNNDGCDPECCKNVLIEGCHFDTGDDCIAIKSGRNADGRRLATPSENIVVRNCTMKDGHGGVVLGSEMSGGVRNIFVENCKMSSPNLERAIRLKSNSLRGGFLENMFVRNVEVGEVSDAVVRINLEYWGESGDYPPTVRNVFIENVSSKKSKYPLYLVGLPEHPIENVKLTNCTFDNSSKPSIIEHVKEISLQNVSQPR